MQNHNMPTLLGALSAFRAPVGTESEARWARRTPKTCVVFVHGFGGRATATWGDFAEMAMGNPAFAEADLVFLGYHSYSKTTAYNASVLFHALKALAEKPLAVLKAVNGPARQSDFAYKNILLVGHSLGGALVREIAMTAKIQGCDWADRLQLALFAPAHLGANIVEVFNLAFGFLSWGPIRAGLIQFCPPIKELESNSEFVTRLLKTAEMIGDHCTTRAKFVVHAERDRVVHQDSFFNDPPALPYPNTDHVSCCKPIQDYFALPVLDVAEVIRC